MSFCEMLLIFRDPVPDSLVPDLLSEGIIDAAEPIFERSYQIAAACSPSDLRYDLKRRLSDTAVYALAAVKHGSIVVDLTADG